MFSYKSNKFSVLLRLAIIFKHDYLLKSVEAINGVIWDKNEGDFVGIFSIQSFADMNEQQILISKKLETHNFDGNILKFTAYSIKNLVEFISNDTMVTGAQGDSWQLIATMLNFKLKCIKVNESVYGSKQNDGSWNGLIGYINRNETDIIPRCIVHPDRLEALDFTLSPWRTTFSMKNQMQYHRTWMTELFSRRLWFLILLIFIILTISSFTISLLLTNTEDEYNDREYDDPPRLFDHVFYIFSIFCIQGWTPSQLEKRSKILLLSIRLFSWLLIIAFSSKLISHITEHKVKSPFENLDSFYLNTDYMLIVKKHSLIDWSFRTSPKAIKQKITNEGRLYQVEDAKTAYEKTCSGRYIFLETQDILEAQDSKLCDMRFVGEPYYTTWIAGGIVRGFKYKKALNLAILKLYEFGLTSRLKLKWLTNKNAIRSESKTFVPIRLEHVSLIFAMLYSAALLSLVLLLIENLVYQFGHIRSRSK